MRPTTRATEKVISMTSEILILKNALAFYVGMCRFSCLVSNQCNTGHIEGLGWWWLQWAEPKQARKA
jgi:hypothetical protein